jgi:hypothetical protein
LSPLLFILATELLQVLVNKAARQGLLFAPILQPTEYYPTVQYADDTLLIMQADARQLFFLNSLLGTFDESIRLRVNYRKSFLITINVAREKNLNV